MGVTVKGIIIFLIQAALVCVVGWHAYDIRMHALRTYGYVIHEFDPWFNFRATQYLADNGLSRFFKWFDYMSWSPLGRPVGTTIYPGIYYT
jgi:dolichyl-diphosphooligosaccharide--protein glycosyltransferase